MTLLMQKQPCETQFIVRGQKIAAKIWDNPSGMPTLALHGWLDNAATFDKLAPLLSHCHIVAVDLPGHGHSDHKPPSSYLHFMDFVLDMMELTQVLGWDKFALLGHSLGGAISSIMAGAVPEKILKVVVIDGLGPLTTPADHAPMQLRLYLNETSAKKSNPSTYRTLEEAIQTRLKVSAMHESSARLIVERGLKQNEDSTYSWRTDPRLLKPSALQLTEEQTLAFFREITAPMAIIRPEPGFPFPAEIIKRRVAAIEHLQIHRIHGLHHVHLDDALGVADYVNRFFVD